MQVRGFSRIRGIRRFSLLLGLCVSATLSAQQIPIRAIVTPSTVVMKDGRPLTFAIHGFIEFKSLTDSFPYIESQVDRWKKSGTLDERAQEVLRRQLVREAVESRVISMLDERPLETLVTHTREELKQELAELREPIPQGYEDAFLDVQQKWKHSLNCWSATPSIPGRVLSNWYPIEEGIQLYGATYDSTEHFWQAVKFHPDTTVAQLTQLLQLLESRDWTPWIDRLNNDPKIYLSNAYAVEFLRANLKPEKLKWFREQLGTHALIPEEHARVAQQRGKTLLRFSAFEEKVLWGDLADVFHLLYNFSKKDDQIRVALIAHHFDSIYLGQRRMGFISEEFRSLMLEIWHVKYLEMPRFREVISSIPMEIRLEHFLNDGDSPDIPISIYVGYLNQIREMARKGEH
ncbi:MAG TPA: hypothetical protein VHR84_14195 [Terriglobales bacterium]|jgi:hypothetical protein|nr:hypothetical protein [Terriglobales bacterium]